MEDPSYSIRFKKVLKKLRDAGKTIIISSHILADLEELADKQIFIKKGMIMKILDQGENNASKNDPLYKVIIPNLDIETIKRIEKIPVVLSVDTDREGQVLVRIKTGHFKTMMEAFKVANIEYKDVVKQDQNLTQLYKKIYNKD
ncbi:hypothetical protein [Listeria aquatica]|uniref:hypothetical protein n=1 Tax=Listeria aquatica TaxID=1494960 RepID=UPI0031F5A692